MISIFRKKRIVGETYLKNNQLYLVVDDKTIREESNLFEFLSGHINFDVSLVTDLSHVFEYRNLSKCQDFFNDWDCRKVKNFHHLFYKALFAESATKKFQSYFKNKNTELPEYILDCDDPFRYSGYLSLDTDKKRKKLKDYGNLIAGDIIEENGEKFLVVDDETIRQPENISLFIRGEINFITTLVTDMSYLFCYYNLIDCRESIHYFDHSNIKKIGINSFVDCFYLPLLSFE